MKHPSPAIARVFGAALLGATFASLALLGASVPTRAHAGELDDLQPDQRIEGFLVEAIYENEAGAVMGFRARHDPSRFVLDVLRIQSVPQAFVWVNSPPPSDRGEPHTLEHLLLGKGTKGRYVASLEDMSLGSSSAYTEQIRTCYHFHTNAGPEAFFELFEKKLDAMLNPTFSDEEIRREVCNMGIVETPQDDGTVTLGLEEKGTVYNEMVSTFERPWANLFRQLQQALFGTEHPLSYSAGGTPEAIRRMGPADIRAFHSGTHHLENMGAIVCLGQEIPVRDCLKRLAATLRTVEPAARAPELDPASASEHLPAPSPAPAGELYQARFPHQNESEPGLLVYAWPARLDPDLRQEYLATMLLDLLANGQTSELHRLFINSQTRVKDIGATSVFGWLDDAPGRPVFIGFSNIDPKSGTPSTMAEVRTLVRDEIARIAGLEPGSDELRAFNERAQNLLLQNTRSTRDFLNSPPRFGYRGTGSAWIDHLQSLHRDGGFRRNLAKVQVVEEVEALLQTDGNPWTAVIADCRLLEGEPYGCAALPEPTLLETSETEREQRIAAYTSELRDRFGVEEAAQAIASYREDYEAKSRIIDEEAASIRMPEFVSDPPLSLDDGLVYRVSELPGAGDLVTSEFTTMTSGTAGLCMNLDVIPANRRVYVPALPTFLTEVGVIENGVPISFEEFSELLRREILRLSAYFSTNFRTQRAELAVRGSGSNWNETARALDWMGTVLFSPDLRPENLPRIRDAIDLALSNTRDRMRRSEESWVNDPADAYWRQKNRMLLSTSSFLTQTHALQRMRWMLRSPGEHEAALGAFLSAIASTAMTTPDRAAFAAILDAVPVDGGPSTDASDSASTGGVDSAVSAAFRELPEGARPLAVDILDDVKACLTGIPEATLAADVRYVCGQISLDLGKSPSETLAEAREVLELLRHRDNVRGFAVGNAEDGARIEERLHTLVKRFDQRSSRRHDHIADPLILARLEERVTLDGPPVFVGLVNENTRSGVHIHTTDCASFQSSDEASLLGFLSARLYGGGGAHSMFMKTWGAGLAYSNGLRSNEASGRLIYYAERCPDLAQTMQFVINELRNAPRDSSLASYAVAQAFSAGRAGARYEQRGEAMADDLTDGLDPATVARFRRGILELSEQEGLYDRIHDLMESTYGEVLPGYGPTGAEARDRSHANYYVIGPEKQLGSWEAYLRSIETDAVLHRLYPRDYWETVSVAAGTFGGLE